MNTQHMESRSEHEPREKAIERDRVVVARGRKALVVKPPNRMISAPSMSATIHAV
jgi:hypothetical protein